MQCYKFDIRLIGGGKLSLCNCCWNFDVSSSDQKEVVYNWGITDFTGPKSLKYQAHQ